MLSRRDLLLSLLSAAERERGVLYLAAQSILAGRVVTLGATTIQAPWDADLAFFDDEPLANWGHSCRYILLRHDSTEVTSTLARFPPFKSKEFLEWQVAYKAPSVPWTVVPNEFRPLR